MISATSSGSFEHTRRLLNLMKDERVFNVLDHYGPEGVQLLSSATPVRTGETAGDWGYEVVHQKGRHVLYFTNTNDNENVNVAVIIQYGHGTGTGGYVEGIDYINPALRPLFDKIVDDVWRQVTNA